MNKYLKLAKTLVIIGGIIELLVSLQHFIWPYAFILEEPFAELPQPQKDFVLLVSVAIGLAMLVFGSLSIYFAFRIRYADNAALVFASSQAFIWTGRLILEFLYPVRIPLYFIMQPSSFVIILCIALILIFLIPLLLNKKYEQLTQQFI